MQGKLFFFIEILFVGHGNDKFFPIQILIFRMLRNMADVRRYSYFELGLPVLKVTKLGDSCICASRGRSKLRLGQAGQWQLFSQASMFNMFTALDGALLEEDFVVFVSGL